MHMNRSLLRVVAGVAILAGLGVIAGTVVVPPLDARGPCETDICNVETGNCANSDARANCDETLISPSSPGCRSVECAET